MLRSRGNSRKSDQSGFTIAEVIVSMTILSFFGLTLYSTLNQGVRLWKRANQERPQVDFDIAAEKMTKDLRNIMVYTGTNNLMSGTSEYMEFYAMVRDPKPDPSRGLFLSLKPARLRYYWDKSDQSINRSFYGYEVLLKEEDRPQADIRPIAKDVKHVSFKYFTRSKKKGKWISRWTDTCLPRAVKVSVRYGDKKQKPLSRVIGLPMTRCIGA